MKKIIVAGLLATGMLVAGSSSAFAGSSIRDCVIEKAGEQLSEGQAALVSSIGDGEINSLSTAQDHDLTLLDMGKIHGFMWSARAACILGN